MPLYDYRCEACGKITEIRHGFNDANSAPCPECGGALKRVFNPAPIIFSGSGFYVTDSRPAKSSAGESSSTPESKPESKPETKPSSSSDSAA